MAADVHPARDADEAATGQDRDDSGETLPARWSGTRRRLVLAAAGTAASVVADAGIAQEQATPAPPAAQATPSSSGRSPGIVIPSTPAGDQLAWFLDAFNGLEEGRDLTVAEVEARFSAAFLGAVPADELIAAFDQTAADLAPVTLTGFAGEPTDLALVALLDTATGETWELLLSVEGQPPYLIEGLLIRPQPERGAPLASWDEFDEALAGLAAQVGFSAAEITPDGPLPLHTVNADDRLAIGSAFKLYVLGELGRQIDEGSADWDEILPVQDGLKSLPSGTLEDAPAGTELTLREYAELMISISDNTATDHLIVRLGRENVEAVQDDMGHGEPAVNVPFLLTRELFALKLAASDELIDRYLHADTAARRELLATEIEALDPTLDDALSWVMPRYIDTLEWFASPEELVNAMQALREQEARPGLEPIRDILALNPGADLDRAALPYVGFKGGSEPGVLTLTWLVERDDGRAFAVSLGLNDPEMLIDDLAALDLARRAIEFATSTSDATPVAWRAS